MPDRYRWSGCCAAHAARQHALVFGSRDWDDPDPIRELLLTLAPGTVVVTGGAKGADTLALDLARELGLHWERFSAVWDGWGKAAGPVRNEAMLAALLARTPYLVAHGFALGSRSDGSPQSPGSHDMWQRLTRAGYLVGLSIRDGVAR